MIALSISAKLRSKLRIHTSCSVIELLYTLQSFGIPSNQIPLVAGTTSNKKRRKYETKRKNGDVGEDNNDNNIIKLNNHIKWLKLCQLKESNLKLYGKKWKYYDENYNGFDQQIIECPKHSDILSGRGMRSMKHPGNILLKRIVVAKLDEYMNLKSCTSKTSETVKLTLDIVYLLKNKYAARFLTEETIETDGKLDCWVEVSDKEARLKVRIAFRDRIKLQQKQEKQQQPQQITNQQQQSPTRMMMKTTENNSFHTQNNNNHQIQQHQQVVEENSGSSTSMFLSMTGGSSGCGCGNTSTKRNVSYKRKLDLAV